MDDHGTARIAGQFIAITHRLCSSGFFAIVIACFIAAGSLMPAENARALPGGDFVRHAVSYGFLSLFALLAVKGWIRSGSVLLAVFSFGATLEYIQPFFGRVSDFHDLIANGTGIVAGLVMAAALRSVRKTL